MTKLSVVAVLALIAAVALKSDVVSAGANDDNPEVMEILGQIGALIKEHYQIPDKPKKKPTPEDLAQAELLDDIRMSVDQAKRILYNMKKRWGYDVSKERIIPNTTNNYWEFPVKYAFMGSQHNEAERNIIRDGFKQWSDNTCATFKEYASDDEINKEPHLRIIKGSGCYSQVSVYAPDGQDLSIGEGCARVGTVAHEVGHALGLWHEFSRPDRDEHVRVLWENIIEGKEHNFMFEEDVDPANTSYDISSLMHYDSLGFSIDQTNKKRVMLPHDIHQLTGMGQRARLQFNDIKRVNFAYGCIERNCDPEELRRPCQNGGYQDPKNCRICRCPPGTSGDACEGVEQAVGAGLSACGGRIYMEPCSLRTLTLPIYPQPYGEDFSCTWRIKTSSKGLAFAFESLPDMPCSRADTCYDFVEIKSNMSALSAPGRFFCTCGENKGRVVTVDNSGEALVRFASTTLIERGGAGISKGFLLNVYATCDNTLASELISGCSLSSTNFESCTGVLGVPHCPANEVNIVAEPTTTTTPTTPTTTTKPTGETTTTPRKDIILIIDGALPVATASGAMVTAAVIVQAMVRYF